MKMPFQFSGFLPNEDLKSLAKHKLSEVLEESPSDADGEIELVMHKGHFEGFLKIRALAGAFVARTMSTDPRAVIEKLVEDIRQQVNKWKSLRYLP